MCIYTTNSSGHIAVLLENAVELKSKSVWEHGCKRADVTGGWKKLYYEKLHNLYSN